MGAGVVGRGLQGVGRTLGSIFKGAAKYPKEDSAKPDIRNVYQGYPIDQDKVARIKWLAQRFYREGSFEKVQFSRKWMRNALMLQSYHELEWSEINVAWDALIRDSQDYSYPNNYYRSHIKNGAALYVQNEPRFDFAPGADDYEAEAIAKAAQQAFAVIKENVNYDYLRVIEAIYLRLFGNSFRYSYYSLDPQYGHITSPVFAPKSITLGDGSFQCPTCGMQGDGMPNVCPQCGNPLPPTSIQPPMETQVPIQSGSVTYPRGQEQTEIVSPMQVGVRTSAPSLRFTPYLYRARVVDRVALQADFPDIDLYVTYRTGTQGDEGVGDAYAAAQDLALIYEQTLADLPGDPTQYAAWYERATGYAKILFLQIWIRPAQYSFDKELTEQFPDGIAADIGDMGVLLESRNESMDDHWVHFGYNFVPGRFWWDGDDDLIPAQLKLNETDRLITRNIAYKSVPKTAVDKSRVDTDELTNDPEESLIVIKNSMGKPVSEAISNLEGQQLPQEVWEYRAAQLTDMEYHSNVSGASIGQHQPGVNTYGGQEFMANQNQQTLSPFLLIYKEGNEQWAKQMLKLAANNWLDDRVKQTQGMNGQWEFTKLRGRMLQLDKVKITAAVLPVDYTEREAFNSAVASGVLNPQDPRVTRKALEYYNLPAELNIYAADAKIQWREIEMMKQGQQVQPMLLRDLHQIHLAVCREWLISDEGFTAPPEVIQMVYMHMQQHIILMQQQAEMESVVSGASQTQQTGQMQPGGGQSGQQQPGQQVQQRQPQAGKHGGQIPQEASARQGRARKGAQAKPNRPQPSKGNQHGRR